MEGKRSDALSANRAALALAHEISPRLDQLAAATRHALSLDPTFAEAWRTLSMMVRRTSYDQEMAAMEQRFADPDASDERRMHLGFALGRMHLGFALGRGFDDLGRWDEACRYFAEGNRLKRAAIDVSVNERVAEMACIERLFTGVLPIPARQASDAAPILVIGLPRSGKTTIERILSRHPEVAGAGELEALDAVVRTFIAAHGLQHDDASLSAIPASDWAKLGADYLAAAGGLGGGRRLVDTMPSNFRYVGFLRLALPGARVIHTVRDPIEHSVALFQKFFASEAYDYSYDFEDMAAYRQGYVRLMALWHHAFPGFVLDVDAADIAARPQAEVRRILEFCGLPWNPACLDLRNVEQRLGEPATFMASRSPRERLAPYSVHLAAALR